VERDAIPPPAWTSDETEADASPGDCDAAADTWPAAACRESLIAGNGVAAAIDSLRPSVLPRECTACPDLAACDDEDRDAVAYMAACGVELRQSRPSLPAIPSRRRSSATLRAQRGGT